MAVSNQLTLEEQYRACLEKGPAEFLLEKGTNGKRLARCAFDGTYQPIGPFDVSEPDALTAVLTALLSHARAAYDADDASFGEQVLHTAKMAARGLHTHFGKYANPESKSQLLRPAQAEVSPYLSSGSAQGMRSITACFSHAPKHADPGKLYLANLRLNGRIVTVAELLAEDHPGLLPAFLSAGVSQAQFAEIQGVFAAAFAVKFPAIDRHLPQLLWPVDGHYVGIVPLPALPVYNAISSLRAKVNDDSFLPRASFLVGSGQAQNISVAATSVAGHFPMLVCEPPRIVSGEADILLRRLHANVLADKLPKSALDKFDTEIHMWPNAKRHVFMARAAKKHVSLVLASAVALRDLIAAGDVALDSLPDSEAPLVAFVAGRALTEADHKALVALVIEHGPGAVLPRHTVADLTFYYDALQQAIAALEAL